MKNLGTKTLETDRLILRKFTSSDAPGMFNGWASDEKVTKYLSWNPHRNIQETQTLIDNWIKRYDDSCYNWVVELKSTHELIGNISAQSLNPASGKVMEKAGMTKDAVLKARRYYAPADSYCDLVCYSIKR